MSKTLVAYFSASGVTARAAKEIADAVGADLYEIAPAQPYTSADLEIAGTVENMDQYDTVFVGFPVWWYVEPRIVDTFLESYDFTGKAMIPFATSGGSGIGGAQKSMKEHCPDAVWKEGRLVNSGAAAWAKQAVKG